MAGLHTVISEATLNGLYISSVDPHDPVITAQLWFVVCPRQLYIIQSFSCRKISVVLIVLFLVMLVLQG